MSRPTLSWVVRRRARRSVGWVLFLAALPLGLALGCSLFLNIAGG